MPDLEVWRKRLIARRNSLAKNSLPSSGGSSSSRHLLSLGSYQGNVIGDEVGYEWGQAGDELMDLLDSEALAQGAHGQQAEGRQSRALRGWFSSLFGGSKSSGEGVGLGGSKAGEGEAASSSSNNNSSSSSNAGEPAVSTDRGGGSRGSGSAGASTAGEAEVVVAGPIGSSRSTSASRQSQIRGQAQPKTQGEKAAGQQMATISRPDTAKAVSSTAGGSTAGSTGSAAVGSTTVTPKSYPKPGSQAHLPPWQVLQPSAPWAPGRGLTITQKGLLHVTDLVAAARGVWDRYVPRPKNEPGMMHEMATLIIKDNMWVPVLAWPRTCLHACMEQLRACMLAAAWVKHSRAPSQQRGTWQGRQPAYTAVT